VVVGAAVVEVVVVEVVEVVVVEVEVVVVDGTVVDVVVRTTGKSDRRVPSVITPVPGTPVHAGGWGRAIVLTTVSVPSVPRHPGTARTLHTTTNGTVIGRITPRSR
jgi:hypothetical protein